ncbi:autotransporter outer membrane beta-barrel domain-containing protein, partial [Altericroceibacterium endophyticum]
MNRNMRRILAAGVSLGALTASPAFADHVPADGQYAGQKDSESAASITKTLEISIADGVAGDVDTMAPASAAVANPGTGKSGQDYVATGATGVDATVDATLINPEDLTVLAYAAATQTGLVSAAVESAIAQNLTGPDGASGVFTNNASLGIYATAIANATDADPLPPVGNAQAQLSKGILQNANAADGEAAVSFANAEDAGLLITSNASALGVTGANAAASIGTAIDQDATGDSAAASVTNDAAFDVNVSADANALSAEADATVDYVVSQNAVADNGAASVSFTNNYGAPVADEGDGEDGDAGDDVTADDPVALTVSASANATGSAADALVDFENVFEGSADGTTSASASFANAGNIDVSGMINAQTTDAEATEPGLVQAQGEIDSLINLAAAGDTATASLTNDGAISLMLDADADGLAAAVAAAGVSGGEIFNVAATGNGEDNVATAGFSNDGSIDVDFIANASGESASAQAGLMESNTEAAAYAALITADGTDGADATASFANAGTVDFGFTAMAMGNAGATSEGDPGVQARAGMGSESGTAPSFVVEASADDADATASLTNSGTVTFAADADALPLSDETQGGYAGASAALLGGVLVDAGVAGNGDGAASLVNDGSLIFSADANAQGSSARAGAAVANPLIVTAEGDSEGGSGTGPSLANASASLANSADAIIDIDVNAVANGTAQTGAAEGFFDDAAAYAYGMTQGIRVAADTDKGDASAAFDNDGTISIDVVTTANAQNDAEGVDADTAFAMIGNPFSISSSDAAFAITAETDDEGNGTAVLSNDGSIVVNHSASATSDTRALAFSSVNGAIVTAGADGDNDKAAQATFANNSEFSLTSKATATADEVAVQATGRIAQVGAEARNDSNDPSGLANAEFVNGADGVVSLNVSATGTGALPAVSGTSFASGVAAMASGIAVNAESDYSDANATLTNNGAINIAVNATGTASDGSVGVLAGMNSPFALSATANDADNGEATTTFTNTGDVSVLVSADANAADDDTEADVTANANAILGASYLSGPLNVEQPLAALAMSANGSDVVLNNSGTMTFGVDAAATGDVADANAIVNGVSQLAMGDDPMVSFVNATATDAGTDASAGYNVSALANATGPDASAVANAFGLGQDADGNDSATVMFDNQGSFAVSATANAGDGDNEVEATDADAAANAIGVTQSADSDDADPVVTFANAGDFNVSAVANQLITTTEDGEPVETIVIPEGDAQARALGYSVNDDFAADFTNTGTMAVSAMAAGTGAVDASATAVQFVATGDAATGTFVNDGTISAMATVTNGDAENIGTEEAPVYAGTSEAQAIGIHVNGDANTATVTNNGTIAVTASNDGNLGTVTGTGTAADANVPMAATGILFTGGTGTTGTATTGTAVINNSGVITAQLVNDGVIEFGTAINVENAPNAVQVNLLGGGDIYGNIELSDDDAITVSGGETSFNGIVNSDGTLDGSLTIAEDGTLYLRDTSEGDGSVVPSMVNVDSLTVTPGGTLALDLADVSPDDAYPMVVTNTADITDGILEVRVASANGLLDDNYSYDNVITSDELTGTFADVVSLGVFTDVEAIYDDENNVDLNVDRVSFDDARFNLTTNGAAVGGNLEGMYDFDGNGDMDELYQALFAIGDADQYANAATQLSGSQYATYLQSLSWMGNRFNGILSDMGECAAMNMEAGALSCKRQGPGIWATANYGRETIDADGTMGAPGLKGDQYYAAIGADMPLGENGVIGFGVGYVKNDADFEGAANGSLPGTIEGEGYQLGLYAAYDPGNYYVKVSGSYSQIDSDSKRTISIGSFGNTLTSSPDADIWGIGGEVGYRLPVGQAMTLVPYAGLDYVSVEYDGFTESGLAPANLVVSEGKDSYATSELGLKLQGQMGAIMPELKVGWRHSFEEDPAHITAAFAGGTGDTFNVYGPDRDQDAIVAGAKLAANVGESTWVELGYEGWMADKQDVHSGFITLRHEFGAAPAAVAPP